MTGARAGKAASKNATGEDQAADAPFDPNVAKRKLFAAPPEHGSATSSPLKDKLEKLRRFTGRSVDETAATAVGSAASSSGPSEPPSDLLLAALGDISTKLDKMALKSDIDDLRADITKQTKLSIAEAIDPLKDEMADLKDRVITLESRPRTSTSSAPQTTSKETAELRRSLNEVDPALKRASFLDWPVAISAEQRLQEMQTFMAVNFPTTPVEFGNKFIGPYSDRKLSGSSWVEFRNKEAAANFLNKLKTSNSDLVVNGTSIQIKPAQTKLKSTRNYAMRKAFELIKACPTSLNKNVEIDWNMPVRKVTVDSVDAFTQHKNDIHGTFHAPFQSLEMP
ncbi:unnamed protein product [Polarella glacialis]|uniref:Uncharacterized protein n=1 Tax=Polarella glacialis TaxID=89957 RepID=A0A813IWF9_POLGL|nr:unnamed protein product [Polarella glacialis]CAE8657090.1 unnamed protein product [Polarella glacialis]